MNLRDNIKKLRNEDIILQFAENYPEAYNWFQSDVAFKRSFFHDTGVSELRYASRSLYHEFKNVEALPFWENGDVVPISEITKYLKAEGFDVRDHDGMVYHSIWVSLEKF